MATVKSLLTAEAYADLPDPGIPTELIQGEIVAGKWTRFMQGVICCSVATILGDHVDSKNLGWVLTNDSDVITQRNPDTVRGADVAFYSFQAVPKNHPPEKYAPNPPELVFEVKSKDDRWPQIQEKVAEYLTVGVQLVAVIDPETATLAAYHANRPVESLGDNDTFNAGGLLGDFNTEVRRFLE